jgi:hypothetical protein
VFAWSRPAKPKDFEATVRTKRIAVARAVREGTAPFGETFDKEWKSFTTKYKDAFETAQKNRCAWCDQAVHTSAGVLDHIRPKAKVARVDPANPGRELVGSGKRDPKFPRKQLAASERGYWWLAFRWTNFVYACERCNNVWKSSFFAREEDPLDGRPLPSPCPSTARNEGVLLLDPFAGHSVSDHLCFGEDGTVKGTSPAGCSTIEVVALDRVSIGDVRKAVHHCADDQIYPWKLQGILS